MTTLNILTLVGGISTASINQRLFEFFQAQAQDRLIFDRFDITILPYFTQDMENDLPKPVRSLKERIIASDGVLFVTPEYNRSIPGVLKNAIDWGSRPWGDNTWAGKPAGIIGASIGAIGTFGAQNHLRQILTNLDMPTMNQPSFYFTFPGQLENNDLPARSKDFLEQYIVQFENWVRKLR